MFWIGLGMFSWGIVSLWSDWKYEKELQEEDDIYPY